MTSMKPWPSRKLWVTQPQDRAISSTKSMTGHLLGAAGAVEAIACGPGHPRRLDPADHRPSGQPDPECDLDYVPGQAVRTPVRAALTNSLGFGGHNGDLVPEKAGGIDDADPGYQLMNHMEKMASQTGMNPCWSSEVGRQPAAPGRTDPAMRPMTDADLQGVQEQHTRQHAGIRHWNSQAVCSRHRRCRCAEPASARAGTRATLVTSPVVGIYFARHRRTAIRLSGRFDCRSRIAACASSRR